MMRGQAPNIFSKTATAMRAMKQLRDYRPTISETLRDRSMLTLANFPETYVLCPVPCWFPMTLGDF